MLTENKQLYAIYLNHLLKLFISVVLPPFLLTLLEKQKLGGLSQKKSK